jgi:cytochrome c oxidase accessory protein FixG
MASSAPQASEPVLSTLNLDGSRRRIHPTLSPGSFLTARRGVAYGLMALFVAIPYFEINGKPLILLDLPAREFTFFGRTFLPTDTLVLMFLGLTIVALVLLMTALLGRVWCGWACPQTVYLEFLYRPIERLFEGKATAQKKLDKTPFAGKRLLKNLVFLIVSMFVAHVFLAYFVGIDRLVEWIQMSPFDHPVAFVVMGSVTALMFFDFASFREQTCIIACPYGRLQSVLLDKQSLVIGYDEARGEPRGKLSKKDSVDAPPLGDCIDCGACVRTCPTGIDIRRGLQMECIGCAQCIDACEPIMDRIGKPRGLIRYSSQDELAGAPRKLLRPRVIIYPVILAAAIGALIYALGARPSVEITILRAPGTPFTVLPGHKVSSQVRLKVNNRSGETRRYTVELHGVEGGELIAPQNGFALPAGEATTATFFVVSPRAAYDGGKLHIELRIYDDAGWERTLSHSLIGPAEKGTP